MPPPVCSAPFRLPDYPFAPEPDSRPPLPDFDTMPRLGITARPDGVVNLDILALFGESSQRPARRKRRGRTEQSTSIGKALFRHAARRAWELPSKRTGAFSAWDDTPHESFAAKPQNKMAKLIDAYLLGGGRITYRAAHIYNRRRTCIAMKPTLTLRLDGYGTWRVEKIDNDLAEIVGYFVDFQQAQRFALHAARLWGFAFDAAVKPPRQPIKREAVIAL